MNNSFKLFTDGSCSNNPGNGGCSSIGFINDNKIFSISKHFPITTNQQMEIRAIILGLAEINSYCYSTCLSDKDNNIINIFSDSAYCINTFNQHWIDKWQVNGWINSKKEPVANKEDWNELLKIKRTLEEKYHFLIIFNKVKGHSGNIMNETVDKLAVLASKGAEINDKYYNSML